MGRSRRTGQSAPLFRAIDRPLFDFATNRIETERAKLTELTPAEEARRRWESVGPDEPPSAILDFDRCPEITRDEEHPEYGLVKGLPPRKRRRLK